LSSTDRSNEAKTNSSRSGKTSQGAYSGAYSGNVLEEDGSEPVRADAGDVTVELSPADVVTVAARSGAAAQLPGAPATEPVQPVFTRYWLHNKGPAPLGNLPVSVYVHPTAAVLPAPVRVTVGSATEAAAGVVDLDVPAGLRVTPAGPLRYDLKPGEYRHFDLQVTAADAAAGQYFLAARIRDRAGQLLEDAVALTVGPPAADPAGLDVLLEPGEVTVAPGTAAALTLRLRNHAASAVRGEAELLSPYGTWGAPDDDLLVSPRTREFALPAGATGTLGFTVTAPAGARPGGRWWALARVTSFGRVLYTATVSLGTTGSR